MRHWTIKDAEWRLTLAQLPGSSDTAASFAFEREDHTLGNALRYLIVKKCDGAPAQEIKDRLLTVLAVLT